MKLILCLFALAVGAMADSSTEEILKAGNDLFTANMFQEVVKKSGDKSCVLSAFSVLSPLAQLALASAGESHDEILKSIGFPNDNVTKEVFGELNSKLRSVKGVDLKQANKVYLGEGFTLDSQFAVVSKDVFNSEVQNINFGDSKNAASEINQWVENHTNNRIKDLVNPDSIDGSTTAILVNAIYFKGKWENPFDKSETKPSDFHVTKDKTVTVDMMHIRHDFNFAENADAKFLELPYEGGETSLVVALPHEVDGVNGLIEKFKDPATLNKALSSMRSFEVDVSLPKFKIETTTNLKEVLENMHIKKLFSPGQARLENLLKEAKDLYVSDATQKAFIEVNEEGAEAAAANHFNVAVRSGKFAFHRTIFDANRPFYYALIHKQYVLFNGIYRF